MSYNDTIGMIAWLFLLQNVKIKITNYPLLNDCNGGLQGGLYGFTLG